MATLIKVNGETETIEDISLKSLQTLVGGFIEMYPCLDGKLMIMNEEGRLVGYKYNAKASKLAGVTIVGDVVVLDKVEVVLE